MIMLVWSCHPHAVGHAALLLSGCTTAIPAAVLAPVMQPTQPKQATDLMMVAETVLKCSHSETEAVDVWLR